MLPELPPPVFASLVGVDVLPSTDYGILQVLNSTGSLDRSFQRNLFDSFNFKIIINSKQLNHMFQYNFWPFFLLQGWDIGCILGVHCQGLDASSEKQRPRQGVSQKSRLNFDNVNHFQWAFRTKWIEIGFTLVDAWYYAPPSSWEYHPTRERHGFGRHLNKFSIDLINSKLFLLLDVLQQKIKLWHFF